MPKRRPFDDLTESIIAHILINPIDLTERNKYLPIAKKFGVVKERVRRIHRTMLKNKITDDGVITKENLKNGERIFRENLKNGSADVIKTTDKRITTLEELIKVCEIDTENWEITSYEITKWEVGRKDKNVIWKIKDGRVVEGDVNDSGKIYVEPLFRVAAKLSRRKADKDLGKQKDLVLKELFNKAPNFDILSQFHIFKESIESGIEEKNCLLEISIFDHHFGKLAHREETGEDYDLKIAVTRWNDAIKDLLSRVNVNKIQKILLPIGNDLFNVDNKNNTTTAFTPQDSDSRFAKVIRIVRKTLIETINNLSLLAPVDVVCIPGNHDTLSVLWLSEILDAYYHNNDLVTIDSSPKMRKYYKFGKTGIQFTHGNEEKHSELGLIFATEGKKMWYETDFHFCQLGHFHKTKKLEHVSVDEFQGFQVQTLPSLSGSDFWHIKRGYMSHKSAKAFLFHETQGLIGEFSHNL